MKFGVVIVTYNRINLLKECMEAVMSQTKRFDEIIIVDNGSNDGTKEYLESYAEQSNIFILRYENNFGGAFGFSEGLKEVVKHDIDWVLLIDDDAILKRNFNDIISRFIEEDTNRVEAYSSTVLTFGEIYIRHRTRHICKNCYWLKSVPAEEYDKEYFDCDSATFCGLVIAKKLVDKIGFPVEEYFIWQDDEEYCERICERTKIRNINSAVLDHKTNGTFNDLSWKMYYGARNIIDSVKRHYGFLNLCLCVARVFLQCLKYMMKSQKNNYSSGEIGKMYMSAVYDGLQGKLGINKSYYPGRKLT